MNACQTISAGGVALQIVGAVLALTGVVLAFKRMERVPESVQRMSATARAVHGSVFQVYLRLRSVSHRVLGWPKGRRGIREARSGSGVITSSATIAWSGRAPHRRLDRQVDKLREDLHALERRLGDVRDELRAEIRDERKSREAGDAEARQFVGDLLARTLDMEIYAAAFILVGVVAANLVALMC